MQHRLQKGIKMEVQDAITKLLESLSQDPSLLQSLQSDPQGTVKSLVGNDLSPQELSNFTKGTEKLFGDEEATRGLMSLLGGSSSQSSINGLTKILLLVGGVSLMKKLLTQSQSSSNNMSSLTQLLGNQQGVNSLTSLIGKKEDEIPDMTSMLNMLSGNQQQSSSGGILNMLGSLLK